MSDKGEATRERIVLTAQGLVQRQGFAGTSLDDVLKATGLTKGAFFHHFRSKDDLGQAIVRHYAEHDVAMFEGWAARADRLSDDPLDRVMILLRLLEEFLDALPEPPAGCIFASFVHERGRLMEDMQAFIHDQLKRWEAIFATRFEAVLAAYPPARPVTAAELAEMFGALMQGAFVLGNAYRDRELMQRQSRLFRGYLELLFARPARLN